MAEQRQALNKVLMKQSNMNPLNSCRLIFSLGLTATPDLIYCNSVG